jgi:SAM-dependent methyltransferase
MQYIGTELDVFATAVNWKTYVRDMLRPFVRGAVLEVGAGKGSFTVALHELDHTRWLCLEPDSTLASDIRKRQVENEIPHDVTLFVGSLADLPDRERFDTILYLDVLEHISDDCEEVRWAAMRLAPGGRLIVLSPAYPTLYSEFDAAIGHFRRYTRVSLEDIRSPDTVTEATFYLDGPGALLSLANRFLLRSAAPSMKQIAFWDRIVVPMARVFDPILGRRFGRSVVVVWQKRFEGSPAAAPSHI